ncbi:T-cell surface glycoprotein CD3 epsilon chain-like [Trachinotus anak]|uniref:T-cell surface glycoprotein CD3 epsilon chain-like n=1 Tax=Trachinotus anak TaxID=443729 RepID=UPI0039F1D6BE
MNSMGVQAVFAIPFLLIATVNAEEGNVEFWREKFTMFCPENGTWYNGEGKDMGPDSKLTQNYNSETKGLYHCKYTLDGESKEYYFYVKGKACEDCFELDATLFLMVIVLDVLGTAFVMMIIFKCTKKKSSGGPTHSSKAPARSGGRAPPVPSPDYEQLNPHTRAQDTYSMVNRTG